MDAQKLKAKRAYRRKRRVRKAIRGTAAKPRLSVFRSNFHIYAQLIDDDAQVTLAAASTGTKGAKVEKGGNITAAKAVGKALAEAAKAKGIAEAAFDRGNYRFHGRVKALARAATEAGLKCTGLQDDAPKANKPAPTDAKKDAKKEGGKKEGGKKEGGEKKEKEAKA
jgi:large subunit ribosomal protein L18